MRLSEKILLLLAVIFAVYFCLVGIVVNLLSPHLTQAQVLVKLIQLDF